MRSALVTKRPHTRNYAPVRQLTKECYSFKRLEEYHRHAKLTTTQDSTEQTQNQDSTEQTQNTTNLLPGAGTAAGKKARTASERISLTHQEHYVTEGRFYCGLSFVGDLSSRSGVTGLVIISYLEREKRRADRGRKRPCARAYPTNRATPRGKTKKEKEND